MRTSILRVVAAVPLLAVVLAGCGGSDDSASSASTPSSTAAANAGANGRGGQFGQQVEAARQCLTAAGISVPTPSGRPSGMPSGMPSGGARPSGPPPSGAAGGFRGGRQGGEMKVFQSKEAQAALKACGITLPTGGPRPSSTTGA